MSDLFAHDSSIVTCNHDANSSWMLPHRVFICYILCCVNELDRKWLGCLATDYCLPPIDGQTSPGLINMGYRKWNIVTNDYVYQSEIDCYARLKAQAKLDNVGQICKPIT